MQSMSAVMLLNSQRIKQDKIFMLWHLTFSSGSLIAHLLFTGRHKILYGCSEYTCIYFSVQDNFSSFSAIPSPFEALIRY